MYRGYQIRLSQIVTDNWSGVEPHQTVTFLYDLSFLSYRGPLTVDLENMSDDEDNGECKTDTSGSSTAGKKNDRRLKKTKIEKKVEKSSK